MGGAVKSVSKAVSDVGKTVSKAVPKVTMDPGKLVSKTAQGVTNLQKDIFIKPTMDLVGTVVGGAGEIMQQPGASQLLGAGLTAFGVPNAGMLSGMLGGGGAVMSPSPAPVASAPAPVVISAPSGSSSNNNMVMIGAAFGGLLLIVILFLGMRGKR